MASIHDLYLQILGRPADPSGRQFYEQQLASGAKTEADIRRELQGAVASGQENVARNKAATQQATAAYKSVLGREPDIDGLGFYAAKGVNEGNAAVINDLVSSPEKRAGTTGTTPGAGTPGGGTPGAGTPGGGTPGGGTPGGGTPGGGSGAGAPGSGGTREEVIDQWADNYVRSAYKSVFGREPDPGGLDFYKKIAIEQGGGAVTNALVFSEEGQQAEQARIQARQDEQKKISDAAAARTATKVADRNNQLADTLQRTVDRAKEVGDTNTVNRLTDQIARLRGQTTETIGADPNRVQAVTDLYRTIFYREPDAKGLAFYTTGEGKNTSIENLSATFRAAPEGRTVANFENLYKTYLGRDPDAEGIRYYRDLFGETIDPSEVARFIDTGRQQSTETLTPNALSFLQNFNNINPLYTDYLGRPASFEEIQSYASQFGETIDPGEREAFIRGGLSSGELTQDRFNELLASLTSNSGTPGGETPGGGTSTVGASPGLPAIPAASKFLSTGATSLGITDPNFLRTSPTSAVRPILGLTGLPTTSQNIQNLYQSYLGRTPSPQEVAIQQQIMGPVISPLKAYDFSYAVADELAGAQGPRNFGGASLLAPPPTFTQPTLTTTAPNAPTPVTPVESRAGGMINYQEGGDVEPSAPPKMSKLSPSDLGSTFNIADYIDEQGRLVGGYSRPIRDEFGVIIGYEPLRPYEEDVVFGEKLRERQAVAPLDSERAMLDMLARQGRTGVNPMTGGLPGIMAREAMMRSQPQYYSTIEAGRRYRGMAKGGLADVAQDLADKGRFGDTMVAHINPQEAVMLKAMGGSGTINPETGLPEYFSLFPKKGISLNFGPLGKVKFGAKSSNIIQAAAALALGDVVGLTAGQASLAYGGVRAAATGNLMEGIQAGLTAYGMGNMYEGLSGTTIGTPSGTAPIDTVQVGSGAGGGAAEAAQVTSQQVASPMITPGGDVSLASSYSGPMPTELEPFMQGEVPVSPTPMRTVVQRPYGTMNAANVGTAATQAGTEAAKQGFLERNLPASVKEYTPDFLLDASGTTLATGTVLGGSLLVGQQERAAFAAQQAAINREREEKKKRFADLASRLQQQYPFEYAKGGVASLAGGGMTYMEAGGTTGPTGTPRDVTGTGDGMSDSVPATIEGVQEARLADGEFVIPADVVADIGNGSSDAGSKKLYDMMDRIRKARHGTTEQPPEIKAERLMPA